MEDERVEGREARADLRAFGAILDKHVVTLITLLVFSFTTLKLLAVSHFDVTSARAVLQAAGGTQVLSGTLLVGAPLLTLLIPVAFMVAANESKKLARRPRRQLFGMLSLCYIPVLIIAPLDVVRAMGELLLVAVPIALVVVLWLRRRDADIGRRHW